MVPPTVFPLAKSWDPKRAEIFPVTVELLIVHVSPSGTTTLSYAPGGSAPTHSVSFEPLTEALPPWRSWVRPVGRVALSHATASRASTAQRQPGSWERSGYVGVK